MLRIIAAVDERGGLSRNGSIPWDSPDDRAHFRRLTAGSTVLMGRATFESIGYPLPGRTSIVMSYEPDLIIPGCIVSAGLASVLKQHQDIWIIGGASLYEQTLPLVEEVHLTEVSGDYGCDRFFPSLKDYGGKVIRYQFAVSDKR